MTSPAPDQEHTAVGAYALGLLDPADAAHFEEHLAGCGRCAAELDELVELPPLLADAAMAVPRPEALVEEPGPRLLTGLFDKVAESRRTRRRRGLYLVAAAAALAIAVPLGVNVTNVASSDGDGQVQAGSAAKSVFEQGEKFSAVDPVTEVDAGVSLVERPSGTTVALRLGNVRGPKECDLVAVSTSGERQTVTTWAVPKWGYGIKDAEGDTWKREPFYAMGGTAMSPNEIDRFEIRTLDGERLADVEV